MWHDSSWGISPGDDVEPERIALKACTYRAVSLLAMSCALRAVTGEVPWGLLAAYQMVACGLYLGLEVLWSRSAWGVVAIPVRAGRTP